MDQAHRVASPSQLASPSFIPSSPNQLPLPPHFRYKLQPSSDLSPPSTGLPLPLSDHRLVRNAVLRSNPSLEDAVHAMLPSTCRHRPETASAVCAACLRNHLSAILSDQSQESSLPRLDRSRSCSATAVGFDESVKNAADQCRKSCHVKVENVSVGERRVNEDVDVCVRWKGRDMAGRCGFDDDLDWGSGDEVKTMKELMEDDWKSKKKTKKKKMDDKKTKKDEKEGDLGSLWMKALAIRERFCKWKMRRKGSKASGDVSSVDLSNAVVKLREKDLAEVRESKDKVRRRSCDAVLVSEGRGSFDGSRGLAGKPRLSLDVNLVERSYGFQNLRLEVSDVSDAKEIDNSVPKRLENERNWKVVGRHGISQDAHVQDSDNGSEGLVGQGLRRRFDRIITNMKVLSPLPVKKVRETSSSRSSPSGAKPISKLLITEKELMEWSSKTRYCEEGGARCLHSHFAGATRLKLSTLTAQRIGTRSNKESQLQRNKCAHYSPRQPG